MGLGPSIKMTTLHHFRCPATCTLLEDEDIEFTGIFIIAQRCWIRGKMDDIAEIRAANHLFYEKKQENARGRNDVIPQGGMHLL